MKTYLSDLFPKLARFSESLDNNTLLTNQHWVSIDEITSTKTVYIFRAGNELLISTNGKVQKARWENLGNQFILIEKSNEPYLFKQGFLNDNVLALKLDSTDEYAVFVNETKYGIELNTIEHVYRFLRSSYLTSDSITTIKSSNRDNLLQLSNTQTVVRETINNQVLTIVSVNKKTIGAKVYIDDVKAPNGIYIYKTLNYKLIVVDGIIKERFFIEIKDNYFIEKKDEGKPQKGDKVYTSDWQLVLNGEIKYSTFVKLVIKNGSIV